MIINLRGGSGSGKSTLVHRYLSEHEHEPIRAILGDWKKEKIIAYCCNPGSPTYVIGNYSSQCGGCDSLSYKGSHVDIESMVRKYSYLGNVIFEGLTVSSTISRWLNISTQQQGKFVWVFMNASEEECHRRILNRNGGKEPKIDGYGLADYQRKYRACVGQIKKLRAIGEDVVELDSDKEGYRKLLSLLD